MKPTPNPTAQPTKQPTPKPSNNPTQRPTPIPVSPPSPVPRTSVPTTTPVTQPTAAGSNPAQFDPYPSGPYILLGESSETITLPDPETPNLSTTQSKCPHWDSSLMDWHDSATWASTGRNLQSLSQPQAGQHVTLPSGTRVIIRRTISEKLGVITIPEDSELIVGQNESGINIDVTGIHVKGRLTIGSETCRLQTPVVVTLHGKRPPSPIPPDPAIKGISVDGGIINAHGKRYFHTWTRLAKTVRPGDKVIMLQHRVNWEKGQQIVIVTSAMKDSRDNNQNEVRVVEAVHTNPPDGVGAVVYLSEPVEYVHLANDNYQVEVGLLSRLIKFQGAPDSEPSDPDPLDGSCRDAYADSKYRIYYGTTMPCMDKELTGFGGHIMVHEEGKGHLEGVELYRMGQTNVLARYPIHFHLLGECASCYFKDSSVHRSFYRCVSIHGTDKVTATENVGFDAIGYCYYLEDGVEQENVISFNLAAHIHTLGPDIPRGVSQSTSTYVQGDDLILPADVTASGFYISNVYNYLEGNAASGGWAGFAFPTFPEPLDTFRFLKFRPSNVPSLKINGNTAHSSGWWWNHASPFYIGGSLYYNDKNLLEYNPGRSFEFNRDNRRPCHVNSCEAPYNNCANGCPEMEEAWVRMTNTKAFLTAGVGLNSWSGRMEVIGFEAHDVRLGIESLSNGFWIDDMLVVCRTGERLEMPSPTAHRLEGSGFYWYDTAQSHIITDATFRNCGLRSDEYDQYDKSPSRGCSPDNEQQGCNEQSTVFGLLTHSDQHTPEIMQGTSNITFDNCGRRFRFTRGLEETVSGRGQNWLDVDGSVSGLNEETFIASGLAGSKDWWGIERQVIFEPQAPLRFIKKNFGPQRSIAHFRMQFDQSLHSQVGSSRCGNGNRAPCPPIGYIRHLGHMFSPFKNPDTTNRGLPITVNPDVVGLAGGYGWLLTLSQGAPRSLSLVQREIDPSTILMLSIPYPVGTTFTITANGPEWCRGTAEYVCRIQYTRVFSVDAVRNGMGDTYHVDSDGILTLRVVQNAKTYVGNPQWFVPSYDSPGRDNYGVALPRFERKDVLLPNSGFGSIRIQARCPNDHNGSPKDGYCVESVKSNYDPDVCGEGFFQDAYDRCCQTSNRSRCKFPNGYQNF